MAELRRKNGREKPWKIKYFGVGNESWGCGGNMRPEYYADLYRRYAIYARDYSGNKLYRIASGANAGDAHWTDVCMKQIGTRMNGLSVHYYAVRNWKEGMKGSATKFNEQEYYETLSQSLRIEDCLVKHMQIMDKYDPKKRIGFLVDEWGTWWEVEPGTNPGHLFQQNTMRDALVASSSLDIFQKYTDRIKMANIAQVVNVLQAMILTRDDQMVLTPTYYVFLMYKPHKEATFVPATLTCERKEINEKESVPVVSSTCSKDKQGVLHLSLSNLDLTQPHVVAVDAEGLTLKGAEGQILNAAHVDSYNDFGQQEQVKPQTFTGVKAKKGSLLVTLPAHSIVTLTLK
jgi:alpha-N-arabinofuranosidase